MSFEYPALQRALDDFIAPTSKCVAVVRSLLLQEKLCSSAADKIIAALGRWSNTPPALILKELEEFQSQYLMTCSARSVGANVSEEESGKVKRLVGVQEMAGILGVKENWLYQRTRLNKIPFTKVGKYNRFDPDKVKAFLGQEQQGIK